MSQDIEKDYSDVEQKGSDLQSASQDYDDLAIEDLGGGAAALQTGILAKMWAVAKATDKYGVEVRGIERVLEKQRDSKANKLRDALWIWFSTDIAIPTFALGMLGPSKFALSGKISMLTILMFNLLASIPVTIFAAFGPRLGLRQMTITRFSFGYYVTWLPVAFNAISLVATATVNSIGGAQALQAVSTKHQIPVAAAIVIIAFLTFIAPFAGYKVVHTYERYAWIPVVIIYLIMLGMSAKYMDMGSIRSSTDLTANVLNFGAACYGYCLGWASYGADYTVQISDKIHPAKVMGLTFLGVNSSLILLECLGAAIATVTRQDWQEFIVAGDVGGLINAILKPTGGFAKFCLVLMALSIVTINVPAMYSFALTFQVFGRYAQAIPRIFLVSFGTIVYIVLAIVGASHFVAWLDSLLVVLGYWLSIYSVIVLEEHYLFRRGRYANYNTADYNTPSRLPLGVAALLAMGCGIAGAVLGMANLWYIGVIGKMIGDPKVGGDIGFELSMAFTTVTYPPLRALERRWESRERRGTPNSKVA